MKNPKKTPKKNPRVQAVRDDLVHYFREKAGFRAGLAEEHPESVGKNGGYANSLERVAAYVGSLPDDDPTLLQLANCRCLDNPDFGLELPPSADADAIHCGPRGGVIDPAVCAEWFAAWALSAVEEAVPFRREQAEEMSSMTGIPVKELLAEWGL
jgi:hypothetical protein